MPILHWSDGRIRWSCVQCETVAWTESHSVNPWGILEDICSMSCLEGYARTAGLNGSQLLDRARLAGRV